MQDQLCQRQFILYINLTTDTMKLFFLGARLQREEEAAYASSHGAQTQSHTQSTAPHPGHASLGPFSKFEEKKTNEKTRKVTTVKKFFSPSSRTAPKKGLTLANIQLSHFCVLLYFQSGLLPSSLLHGLKGLGLYLYVKLVVAHIPIFQTFNRTYSNL